MLRRAAALSLSAALLLSTPVFAVTTKEKQETCKFGADDQKLKGAAREKFVAKCMANADAPAKPKRDKEKK